MQTYNYRPDFLARVLSGDIALTFRKVGTRKHAIVGDTIVFNRVEGDRGEMAVAQAVCTLRARVVITAVSLPRLLDCRWTTVADGLSNLLYGAEDAAPQPTRHREMLAQRLGFADWAALFENEASVQGGGRRSTLLREVIGWTDAKAVR